MDLLDRLLGHDLWTTRQLMLQCKPLSDEELDRAFEVDSRSLRECFVHIVRVMEVWNDLLYERTPRTAAELDSSLRSLDGLMDRLDKAGREFAELAKKISRENRWDAEFVDVLDQPPRKKTFGGTIAHVITHSMHHRAQAMYMMEQLGIRDHIEGDALGWEQMTKRQP